MRRSYEIHRALQMGHHRRRQIRSIGAGHRDHDDLLRAVPHPHGLCFADARIAGGVGLEVAEGDDPLQREHRGGGIATCVGQLLGIDTSGGGRGIDDRLQPQTGTEQQRQLPGVEIARCANADAVDRLDVLGSARQSGPCDAVAEAHCQLRIVADARGVDAGCRLGAIERRHFVPGDIVDLHRQAGSGTAR